MFGTLSWSWDGKVSIGWFDSNRRAVDGVFGPMDPLMKSAVSSDDTLLLSCNITFHKLISRTLAIDVGILNSSASSGEYAPMSAHSTCMLADCRQAEVLAAGVLALSSRKRD